MIRVLPVIWGVASVFSIAAGPFGTFEALSLEARAIYWPTVIAGAVLVGAMARVVVQEYWGLRTFETEALAIALLTTALLTVPIHVLTVLMVPAEPLQGVQILQILRLAAYIFFVSMAASVLRYVCMPRVGPLRPSRPEPDPLPECCEDDEENGDCASARLFARLHPDRRAPIVRLQMRDHYVDVITTQGTDSLLMRFADAIAELDGVNGLRVHRSHWVALDAVRGIARERGRAMLHMTDGMQVPVSRTYLPEVERLDLPDIREVLGL